MAKKKRQKRIYRKFNDEYRVRYLSYDDVKTTKSFKKELLRKINYTLSYSKIITKAQRNIIKNIKNAKTQKTIVKNLERLWRTDYGLFKRQLSQPGIGFVGRKNRSKIGQEKVLRENAFLDFQERNNLNNRAEVFLYLAMQHREAVLKIFAEYNIYCIEDIRDEYSDRARRAVERVKEEIPALEDLSFFDIIFIAFG